MGSGAFCRACGRVAAGGSAFFCACPRASRTHPSTRHAAPSKTSMRFLIFQLPLRVRPSVRTRCTAALAPAEDEAEDDEDGDEEEDEEENLPEAVGALALHLAGAPVDDELVDLVVEAVRADVDGQQEVFEGDGRVVGRDVRDALLVAADV